MEMGDFDGSAEPQRWEKLLARISLRNPAIATRLRLRPGYSRIGATLEVRLLSPHRDTGEMIEVSLDTHLRWGEDYPEGYAIHQIMHAIEQAWLHELRECFHVDGVRIKDPHGGEK